jgi:5-(carboxyamino)imidazole ribonucleotide synthase
MKIGVLGGGQLGRMMALAAYPLGLHLRFLDRAEDASAGQVAESVVASFEDEEALRKFAAQLDLVTYEFENVPAHTAHFLSRLVARFLPPPQALEIVQDRLTQKLFFCKLGIPTADFASVSDPAEFAGAIERTGLPAVVKTRRWGYDGKGQVVLHDARDAGEAWKTLGGHPLIVESFVPFERELSLVSARCTTGETAFYPLTENHHRHGILRLSLAPAAGIPDPVQELAESYAGRVLQELAYAGILTIEFFYCEGTLLANEMATRVHNSGHWTIEGAETSQFENHLRAICGLPLGAPSPRGYSAMANFIGAVPDTASLLAIPGLHLHLYGKSPRPGRKLGHATISAASPELLAARLGPLCALAGCETGADAAARDRRPQARTLSLF